MKERKKEETEEGEEKRTFTQLMTLTRSCYALLFGGDEIVSFGPTNSILFTAQHV